MVETRLPSEVEHCGQRHVLQFWDELTPAERASLVQQLEHVDWSLVEAFSSAVSSSPGQDVGVGEISPPSKVVRKPKTQDEIETCKIARLLGEKALSAGKVAAILLAGGQGTRLGFPHPKGMFPIGPVSGKPLFAILAEQIVALTNRYGHSIPYLVMTSDVTHKETIDFFQQSNFFGLSRNDVFFFQQGFAPSLDSRTGRLLLAEKGVISMNPDGHGGLLAALLKAGLFEEMQRRGVEYVFSHQIDNPLVKACDPEFIGLHIQHQADVSTKVVAKTGPEEKVGVAVNLNGRTAIIEYSDLSKEAANQREPDGELRFWAGSTAIHLFGREFLERIAKSEKSLPWHRALKKVPYIDAEGKHIQPAQENGIKFERFLFDTMPIAKTALIVETIRADEFAPLKNQSGDFSADYVRQQMSLVAAKWLRSAGFSVPENIPIEISPLFALSADELAARKSELSGLKFDRPVYLDGTGLSRSNSSASKSISSDTKSAGAETDPVVFDSYCRPQIWGGRGLSTNLGRKLRDDRPYGESWELSPQSLHVSRVTEGVFAGRDLNDLWVNSRKLLTGGSGPASFPLLVKWLECRELLSLQVHPDDQLAQRLLNEPYGKSEAWVVVSVEPTARVFAGMKPGVTRHDVVAHLNTGTLADCLHSFVPRVGDCISLPAGTIHAAGGGLMVAEIQQSSDATFRLFDWNRTSFDGKPRELHIEKALEAIDWDQGPISPISPVQIPAGTPGVRAEKLVDGEAFRLERFEVQQSFPSPHVGEFTVWMVLDGKGWLSQPSTGYHREFTKGSTVVVPASTGKIEWKSGDSTRALTLLCTLLPATQ